jgi:beta-phosphoglucomutase-like phosphatase (HAD superfamily)
VDHYLDLLDACELADAWTTSADVESTKPAPDLVSVALERYDSVIVSNAPKTPIPRVNAAL